MTITAQAGPHPAVSQRESAFLHVFIPPRAVFNRGETPSMTSEVMGGRRACRMVPSLMQELRDYWAAVSAARGFIGGEKAFDAQTLFLHDLGGHGHCSTFAKY